MANEREPPRKPTSPHVTPSVSHRPGVAEFGKTSIPVSPLPQRSQQQGDQTGLFQRPKERDPEAVLFNRPRLGQSRPEHHRPVTHNPLAQATNWAKGQIHKISEPHAQPKPQPNAFDPYRPSGFRPASSAASPDVVEIPRPAGFQSWTTKAAPPPMFSSRAGGMTNDYVDLTKSATVSPLNMRKPDDGSYMADPSMYMDAGKANENLKALLEGAFEDEEDKPRTRSRKKKQDKATDDLADALAGLDVKDKGDESHAGDEEEEDEEDDGTVEGLKVKLLPHQIEGVTWMREKETGVKKTRGVHPKGGILADDMGLGKTIQSIGLMLTNPLPADYDPKPPADGVTSKKTEKGKLKLSPGLNKGTLVVAPLALIKQWEAEIKDRVEDSHALKVYVHHGPQRLKRSNDLKKYDVVITTYQILVSEHGASEGTLRAGVFGVNWYRIILDEAHTIKNRNAKATQAAYALDAEYRWCLSGTPMQNNLDELQSLIRFLRIKPYDDLATWRDQISRPMNSGRGGLAIRRLQVYLKAFMKRRTKDILKQEGALRNGPTGTTQDGKSTGFKIVKRSVEKIETEFTDEERQFYERLEQRTDRSLEQMMKGSALSYASALVLLLRLRQACNHPQLVKSDLSNEKETFTGAGSGLQSPRKKPAKTDDLDGITDMLGGLSVETKRCDVCQIELTAKESSSGAIRCAECEVDLADEEKTAHATRKKSKDKSKKKRKSRKSKHENPPQPRTTAKRVINDSDDEDDKGDWLVPEEQRLYPNHEKAGGSEDENAEGGGEWIGPDDSDTEDEDVKPARSEKKDAIGLVSDDENAETNSESGSASSSDEDDDDDETSSTSSSVYDPDAPSSLTPAISTKIRQLLQILRHDSSTHKYIVFSFFTSMLDLIEPFLRRENLAFTRYDGAMKNDLREASLDRLRNHDGTRILLCSLRAGSLGLNLTAASRVVILEPFWNPFVEEQAIDRVHRLNQSQDVIVYKLTIKDTVEARILALQDKKRELANATIEGGTAGKKGDAAKLTLRDMLALFRRDAEHEVGDAHDSLDFGLAGGNRVEGGLLTRPTSSRDGSRGSAGLVEDDDARRERLMRQNQRPKDKQRQQSKKVAEHGVYGRRW